MINHAKTRASGSLATKAISNASQLNRSPKTHFCQSFAGLQSNANSVYIILIVVDGSDQLPSIG